MMQKQGFKAVLGMYPTRAGVEFALEAFRDAGFRSADISLLLPETMTYDDSCAQNAVVTSETLPCDVEVSAAAAIEESVQTMARVLEEPILTAPPDLATAITNLGIPVKETEDYACKVLEGKALLSIRCDSPEKTLAARRLHGDLGGMDVFVSHSSQQTLYTSRAMACSAGK